MKQSKTYIGIVAVLFIAFTVLFDTFPRPAYSELEKRDLKKFPAFTLDSLKSGAYNKAVAEWFNDSEPYRDNFMAFSMMIEDFFNLKISDDNVTFHASTSNKGKKHKKLEDGPIDPENRDLQNYVNQVNNNDKAKVADAGIIIVGKGKNVRALMAYGGGKEGGGGYALACNTYKKTFGKDVNVYCLIMPTATEYYLPEKAASCSKKQLPTIQNCINHLDKEVKVVDVYTVLGKHANEDIYLRTDHHWSPLGAYYAAREFAKVAKVPFKDLKSYTRKVVHGYVGSMYGYSNDIALKNAPEDFVYYVPKDIKYATTYIQYTLDEEFNITAESHPFQTEFFMNFKDGSSGAYCTFMGGDAKITVVRTGNKNGRRLIILKDSFGNAIPGYLFYSFQEIHVIDHRYFTKNMKQYVADNKITDILFANNTFEVYGYMYQHYLHFLEMPNGIPYVRRKVMPSNDSESTQSVEPSAAEQTTPATTEAPIQSSESTPTEQ